MNLKDKLIKKLVNAGKKHKILVYPSLMMIAVISAISHAIYWGKGNGKKLIASILVFALLITQSLFLTSSADYQSGGDNVASPTDVVIEETSEYSEDEYVSYDDEGNQILSFDEINEDNSESEVVADLEDENSVSDKETVAEEKTSNKDVKDKKDIKTSKIINNPKNLMNATPDDKLTTIKYAYIRNNASGSPEAVVVPGLSGAVSNKKISYINNVSDLVAAAGYNVADFNYTSDLYTDMDCTMPVTTGADLSTSDLNIIDSGSTCVLYFKMNRINHDLAIVDEASNTLYTDSTAITSAFGDIDVTYEYTVKAANEYGIEKYGYDFSGLTYNGNNYAVGETINIDTSVDKLAGTAVAVYTGQKFNVACDPQTDGTYINPKGTGSLNCEMEYGKEFTLPGEAELNSIAVSKGYYFVGWSTNPAATEAEYAAGQTLTIDQVNALSEEDDEYNIKADGKTLYAIWKYRNIDLVLSNSKDGSLSDSTLSAEYGDSIECSINAKYKDDAKTDGNFSYFIQSGESELNELGLSISETKNAGTVIGYKITGNAEKTGSVTLTVHVQDTNMDSANPEDTDRDIIVIISPKKVSLVPTSVVDSTGKAISKTYDGTKQISTSGKGDVSKVVNSDDIYVTFDQTAELETPDVGTGKAVFLSNVGLGGAAKDNYELVGIESDGTVKVDGVAKVTRSEISIAINIKDGFSDKIKFGEITPEYYLTVVNPDDLSEADRLAYEAITDADDYNIFAKSKFAFSKWDCSRTLYSSPGTYSVTPIFDSTSSNYTVSSNQTEFEVSRDKGDEYYTLSSSPVNGRYPGLTIKGKGDYSFIRYFIEGADSDIAEGSDEATVKAKFAASVTLPDMSHKNIKIQMMNPATGAITKLVSLDDISVDTTAPVLSGYTVSPEKAKFNILDFGAYYHPQATSDTDPTIISNVGITFDYVSEGSACDKLYYCFYGDDGKQIGGVTAITVDMSPTSVANHYQATISIANNSEKDYGKLVVWAKNTTDIYSAKSIIKFDFADVQNYDESGDKTPYYEWMVESNLETATINVTDKDGNTATTDDWYQELNLSMPAKDLESGLSCADWIITGPDGTSTTVENAGYNMALATNKTSYNKILEYTFTNQIADEALTPGEYTISAVLYDNAKNSVNVEAVGPYKFDHKKPDIKDTTDYSAKGFDNKLNFTFTATEGATESGIASVELYQGTGANMKSLKIWGKEDSYSYVITENDTYTVVATDNAGNVATYENLINNLSDVIPDKPIISVTGTQGNAGWYIENEPHVTISAMEMTSDNVPVTTYYEYVADGSSKSGEFKTSPYDFDITKDGLITINAYSVSDAGISSDTATVDLKVDTVAPFIEITGSSANEDGDVIIQFKVKDDGSGVDKAKVLVNGKAVSIVDNDGVITGEFLTKDEPSYVITASDIAGNDAKELTFKPLLLKANPITDITADSAYLEAKVIKGTYDIAESYIQYKKSSDSTYETALSNKYDEDYGKKISYLFRNLQPNTSYDYIVYASAKTSNEVRQIKGSFRTSDDKAKGMIYGTAKYGDLLAAGLGEYPIYVTLYDGNTLIKSALIENATDTGFKFTGISDGNYRISAHSPNGLLYKETAITVSDGGVSYPENYLKDDGINFVLDGLSTEVRIKDGAINITADGLSKIFESAVSGAYNGNVTPADLDVVANGGTIKIILEASCIDVDGTGVEGIFESKLGEEADIFRYIQLVVIKEVRDASGALVNGSPVNLTRLYEPITVSFPLGDHSGQKVYVASLHGQDPNYSFMAWNNGTDASLSNEYVTINTDKFSVYALYKMNVKPKKYTVKWIDGDGNIMKTETVEAGKKATPPTKKPTKRATSKYTYTFEGWDTDYSSIGKDTIISAWFTAHEIPPVDPTTEDPKTTENPTTEDRTTEEKTTESKTTESKTTESKTTQTTTTTQSGGGEGDISKQPTVRYTYMGSAGSPKTGDASPILLVTILLCTSSAGLIILGKKKKNTK